METRMFISKLGIINHFDKLIHQVDIDIEESIKNYSENQVLGDLQCFKIEERRLNFLIITDYLSEFGSSLYEYNNKYQTVELWSESTKVVDYLNQVRMRTIDELRKAQEESLANYTRCIRLKKISDENKTEELKSQLFAKKFYFQVRLTSKDYKPWIFNLFTFVTDFDMSPPDIDTLEMFINKNSIEISTDYRHHYPKPILDEKMVLICLLTHNFFDNLSSKKYPNHVISVIKRDILNIEEIYVPSFVSQVRLNCSLIDLSKLERLISDYLDEIELDGLLSLHYLELYYTSSFKRFSVKSLPSLKHLVLKARNVNMIKEMKMFENLTNIRKLEIKSGVFSDINLDDLVNLEKLSISDEIDDGFNFELFKIICNHLQELSIDINNIDNESISKLFYGHKFPYLVKLQIKNSKITKLEKKLFKGFPMLQSLSITNNRELRKIDKDAFSSLTNLFHLDLSWNIIELINQLSELINLETLVLSNNAIECIEENAFSNLKNLKKLELNSNNLSKLNPKLFIGLIHLKYLDLRFNKLTYFDLSIFDFICNINIIALFSNYIVNRDEIFTCIKAVNEGKIRIL